MKAPIVGLALVLLLTASSAVASSKADAKGKKSTKTKAAVVAKAAPATETVYLTGSYIKQPITRAGLITDASSQVIVIDRKAIERSGAGDLRGVLLRYGYSGRR